MQSYFRMCRDTRHGSVDFLSQLLRRQQPEEPVQGCLWYKENSRLLACLIKMSQHNKDNKGYSSELEGWVLHRPGILG